MMPMKKKFTLLFLIIPWMLSAQPYGNEWIAFTVVQPYSVQQYVKIKVWQNGIHRITYNDLIQVLPGVTIVPRRLQLFHKGVEQYIYVHGEADNVFDTTDYIEFYGEKNDGTADTQLYDTASWQLNPYYSLFNDTAAYFLTMNINPNYQGKRMIFETASDFQNYTPSAYGRKEVVKVFTTEYYYGFKKEFSSYASSFGTSLFSPYNEGEGFTAARNSNLQITEVILTPHPATASGLQAIASTIFLCTNSHNSNWNISVNGIPIATVINEGPTMTHVSQPIAASALAQGNATFSFQATYTTGQQYNSYPYVKIDYPRLWSFAGDTSLQHFLTVIADPAFAKTRLDITGYLPSNPSPRWIYVFSGDTIRKVQVFAGAGIFQALIPTFYTNKKILLTMESATITSAGFTLQPVSTDPVRYARFTNFGYQNLLNSDYLIISHPRLWSKAEEYKNYRSSLAGGGFKVLLADIEELYDQFAWGIRKSPLAIRNFCDYVIDNYPQPPLYLFLLGKSIRNDLARKAPALNDLNLVPTFGDPPSDQMLVSRLNTPEFKPEIAIGRLAARTLDDVDLYLEKVMAHDAAQNDNLNEWTKQVIHFGGGTNASEQAQIRDALKAYEDIIEDTLFAGHVTTVLKTTSDPIQVNQSAFLQQRINNGVALMTFFAHAAGSTFDITTDEPENYNNKDKYPVMLANSCFIGDIHVLPRQYSERFVLLRDKGAIAFIASPNIGFIPEQSAYSIPFYRQVSSYSYGQGIGLCMKRCVDSVFFPPSWLVEQSLRLGMTLHGDPAIRLFPKSKPDLSVVQPDVSFLPSDVSTDLASFDMQVIIRNYGRAINKPFLVRITRKFPDGSTPAIFEVVKTSMPFVDTLRITIPMDFQRAAGLNLFDVEVDANLPPDIDEITKANNNLYNIPLLIRSSDIIPIYPPKYAIVPDNTITLKASTSNLFAPLKSYRFEIDTTDRFNTPFKISVVRSSTGGIVPWQLPFTLVADRVYYWRVANDSIYHPDTSISNRFRWNESSFVYKPGKTGWSQAHYSQFKENEYKNVVYKNQPGWTDTTFTFVKTQTRILVHNAVDPNTLTGAPVDFYINNTLVDYGGCYNQINVAVLDSITLEAWNTRDHAYFGNWNKFGTVYPGHGMSCGGGIGRNRPDFFFAFKTDSVNAPFYMDSLNQMLTSPLIKNGMYLIIYSIRFPNYQNWPLALRQTFQNMGSQIVTLTSVPAYWKPFIMLVRKGFPAETMEILGDSSNMIIQLEKYIGGNWDKGFVVSVPIGPSQQWSELHWNYFSVEQQGADSIYLSVIGVDTAGIETPLINTISPPQFSISLSGISATDYPFIKLRAYLQDAIIKTPPQLLRWQIYYTPVPEGALNPQRHFAVIPQTYSIQEGETYRFEIAFENISNTPFSDSLLVDFFAFGGNNQLVPVSSTRYKKLQAGEYFIAAGSFNTIGYAGNNSLWIEVNPRKDQPEQYHFNNLAAVYFKVHRDITNPILDVTFDGRHILDGDIVSAKPHIVIKLKDENKFIALNDTNKYRVFLTDPSGVQRKLAFESAPGISTDRNKMKYTPAVLPDNSFTIEYNPWFEVDGIYKLDVQASDESGNLSGQYNYRISFEVINQSTITEVINYPNPFSTSTRFVFTLTGSEIPTQMKIQIMTVSGKIVREIFQDEIGPVYIGRNITQFAWDGTDQYGDRLANGVYLYRVITQLHGQDVEKRPTEADKYFKKGWGKMYLMR
jgi:hypothetical protein